MELNKGYKSEYDALLIDRLDLRENYGLTLNCLSEARLAANWCHLGEVIGLWFHPWVHFQVDA